MPFKHSHFNPAHILKTNFFIKILLRQLQSNLIPSDYGKTRNSLPHAGNSVKTQLEIQVNFRLWIPFHNEIFREIKAAKLNCQENFAWNHFANTAVGWKRNELIWRNFQSFSKISWNWFCTRELCRLHWGWIDFTKYFSNDVKIKWFFSKTFLAIR